MEYHGPHDFRYSGLTRTTLKSAATMACRLAELSIRTHNTIDIRLLQ